MIQQILSILDAAANGAMPIHERIGLAEMRSVDGKMRPTYYLGGTDAKQIVEDHNGSVSYWRMLGPIRQTTAESRMFLACAGIKRTYPLRLVMFMDRSDQVCSNLASAVGSSSSAMIGSDLAIGTELHANAEVFTTNIELDPVRTASQELPGATLPIQKAMAYVDVNVEIQGEPRCFDEC